MLTNIMYKLGCVTVPKYLVKHYVGLSVSVFLDDMNI